MSATARVTGHARNPFARWLERASTAAKRFNQRMLRDVEIIELQADARCTFIGNKSRATGLCAAIEGCFRHQLLLPRPYLVLTKPLRLDIQCQRGASVKIGWKYLDD